MNIEKNISLLPYNTFGINVSAASLLVVHTNDELVEALKSTPNVRIIGGGSNVLLTKDITEVVICNQLKGIKKINEDNDHIWLEVQSGEIWHDFVLFVIENGWAGIENLALIPGTVGAAPIQNIGAYGVEVKDAIEQVNFRRLTDNSEASFSNAECKFGYRDSIFKNELKGQIFISSVVFKLRKKAILNTSYGAIRQELEKMGISEPTPKSVAQAVINIRSSKLPDPKKIGNAGSFFKNPTITTEQYRHLCLKFPDMPSYPVSDRLTKIPAGWLIEQCGWKGYRTGDIGVHAKQALVLVNYGKASGNDIYELSELILNSVKDKFGINLEREVQIW